MLLSYKIFFLIRLVWKADILLGQIKDQFPPPAEIDTNSVLKGHSIDRWAAD